MYRKTKQITAYWLFVMDICHEFHVHHQAAHVIASEVWPDHPIQPRYKEEARQRKEYLRYNGPFRMSPAKLLTPEVRNEILNLL